jgi:hypothetical protein
MAAARDTAAADRRDLKARHVVEKLDPCRGALLLDGLPILGQSPFAQMAGYRPVVATLEIGKAGERPVIREFVPGPHRLGRRRGGDRFHGWHGAPASSRMSNADAIRITRNVYLANMKNVRCDKTAAAGGCRGDR